MADVATRLCWFSGVETSATHCTFPFIARPDFASRASAATISAILTTTSTTSTASGLGLRSADENASSGVSEPVGDGRRRERGGFGEILFLRFGRDRVLLIRVKPLAEKIVLPEGVHH